METNLTKFKISPRVLKADSVQTVKVKGLDDSCELFDDTEYKIKIIAVDDYGYKSTGNRSAYDRDVEQEIIATPIGGVLSFSFFAKGEHLWHVIISRVECEKHQSQLRTRYWPVFNKRLLDSMVCFDVYSVAEDLFNKRPFKGDMHVHTYGSDGNDSPELFSAIYRKNGFDFMAITDHYTMQPSLSAIDSLKQIETEFKVFAGEEVHCPDAKSESFHVVNFNPKTSVNKWLDENWKIAKEEVSDIANRLDILDKSDAMQVAWYDYIYKLIKESGGIAIYPHPFWEAVRAYNIKSAITEEVYKRKLCDVIEVFGGTDNDNNKLQMMLYYQMKEKGYNYPMVASSDAHNAEWDKHFNSFWSIVFAETSQTISESVLEGNTVVVDAIDKENKTAYGPLRLARYAYFLFRNYYPKHDELCNASGQALIRYVLGDKEQKTIVELLEKEIEKFNCEFFGK